MTWSTVPKLAIRPNAILLQDGGKMLLQDGYRIIFENLYSHFYSKVAKITTTFTKLAKTVTSWSKVEKT